MSTMNDAPIADPAPFAEFPVIDLERWRSGDEDDRRQIAEQVDYALSTSGFLMLANHGIDTELIETVRGLSGDLFALPAEIKGRYRSPRLGSPGWLAPGVEANGYASGEATPADLKEAFSFGPTGDHAVVVTGRGLDESVNVYPSEIDGLGPAVDAYLDAGVALSQDLFVLLADALGLPARTFAELCASPLHTMSITWYPPLGELAAPLPGQYRIGPHTDFGTITILQQEPSRPGLQVLMPNGEWADAPHVPGALIINCGDLLAHWSGGRWTSNMHRILAPTQADPDEGRLTLVMFFEADHDAVIRPITPVRPGASEEAIGALEWVQAKMFAISTEEQ
ncbi:2-oxoglutarate and iron-dependent oxygenase domain-containing protein [soil metagenome]